MTFTLHQSDISQNHAEEVCGPLMFEKTKKKRVKKNRDELVTKTLKFKVRNPHVTWLENAAAEVNTAWNYANETSYKAISRFFGKPNFLSSFDLNNLTAGSSWSAEKPGKEPNPNGFTHISNAVVQEVNKEYVTRRQQFHKNKLKWRKSTGSEKSLGWIPFKQESLTINWQGLKIAGKMDHLVRLKNIHQASELRDQLMECQAPKKDFKPSITCLGRHIHVFNEDYLLSHLLDLAATVVSGNFSQDSLGDWYMNLVIDIDRSDYVKSLIKKGFSEVAPKEVIGIDPGSKTMLGCSDGTIIEPPQFYRQAEQKLASLQKNARPKQAKRLHRDIKRKRDDFNQKLTTKIVKENQTIKYGSLNVKGLVKRKKLKKRRTASNSTSNNAGPAQEVLQKRKTTKNPRSLRLAKSLLDNGLGQVKMLLSVKSHWAGRAFHEVDEKYTTQVCSNCDAFTGPKGLKQLVVRTWVCSACETEHQRDVCSGQNLARVIPGKNLLTSVPRCGHLFAEMKTFEVTSTDRTICRWRGIRLAWPQNGRLSRFHPRT